jgi:hypothetical protein
MFQLIFKGECVADTDLAAARSSARQLFKANDAQLDRMFSGKPVVIRNQLDQATAEKYRALLQKHGMRSYVQTMAPAQAGPQAQPACSNLAPQSAAASPPPQRNSSEVLAGSALTLDPAGVTLAQPVLIEALSFDHLDAWSRPAAMWAADKSCCRLLCRTRRT